VQYTISREKKKRQYNQLNRPQKVCNESSTFHGKYTQLNKVLGSILSLEMGWEEEILPFIITSKRIKYLGICLMKET
jgi:hypothetical protein